MKDKKDFIDFAIELNDILIGAGVGPINYGPYPFIETSKTGLK